MSASAAKRTRIPDPSSGHTLEFAHVLFTDIVGYSKFPMDEQEQLLTQFQDAVRHAVESVQTCGSKDIIRLPTGDGVALVFFRDAEAPARCALELTRLLRNSRIRLRMGIHAGPVYRVADINTNRNVAGGGINIAQRVMDSGDAGHILVSSAEAEVLEQISTWSHTLHALGEAEVKHGVRLKIYNLYSSEVGNPEIPRKIVIPRIRYSFSGTSFWISAVIVILVSALIGGRLLLTHKAHALSSTDTIVLADFSNTTGDEVFNDALKVPMQVGLGQSQFLNILSDDRVDRMLEQMTRSPGERLTPDLAREVCQRAGSKAFLAGSIAHVGGQYLIGLEAKNCATGDVLAREQVTALGKDQVVANLDKALFEFRRKLGESLSNAQKSDVPLAQATTTSLEALRAYSLGRKTSLEPKIALTKHAIELDPNFAMAYDLLGNIYSNLDQPIAAAEYMKKAFDLRDRTTKEEKLKIAADYFVIATGELEKANEKYELEIQLYPLHPHAYDSHVALGINYLTVGRYEKAAAETLEALRLDVQGVAAYTNLSQSYIALNRFDDARIIIDESLEHKIEQNLSLYALAFFSRDLPAMNRYANAVVADPSETEMMLSEESDTEAWYGRLGKARALSQQARESALRNDKKESAALFQANSAIREALLGNAAAARRDAGAALKIASHSRPAEAQVALAYALVGDATRAQALQSDLAARYPQDTIIQSVWLPTIRAQTEIDRTNASQSLDLLQIAAPYELGILTGSANKSCLYPVYIRAQAYLKVGQDTAAAAEFQKILNHRGLLWNCATGPLSHLGLGRAFALQGNVAKARAAYQDFFALWRDADSDIPILITAKSEYAMMGSRAR
jgi:tetratricopeptide (TPR) repeat protein